MEVNQIIQNNNLWLPSPPNHFTVELPFCFVLFYCFSRQGISVALEPVLEPALVDQAGLKLTEIHLPLPPECWD